MIHDINFKNSENEVTLRGSLPYKFFYYLNFINFFVKKHLLSI